LSALRRNFFTHVAQELRTVEHTLTYVEAALRRVPCHRIFIAHYEHILADPRAFLEPLSQFLEVSEIEKKVSRMWLFASLVTPHTLRLLSRDSANQGSCLPENRIS
jgi:hypothetical protein